MSHQKQPELNGAYYGPPIPPPPKSYHRHSQPRRGCCCGGCCLFHCLCDCIMSCLYTIICTLLIILAFIALLSWLIIRPHKINLYASNASLTTFNFTTINTLNFNLAVNFTLNNPNNHIGVYYDSLEANAVYSGQRFGTVQGPVFYQGHKNSTGFGPLVWKGQHVVVLGSGDRVEFDRESNVGVYDIQVRINLKVRFKVWWFKTGTWKPKIKCDLKVPLKGVHQFEKTKCHYDL